MLTLDMLNGSAGILIDSFDFGSSYPYHMLTNYFPVTPFHYVKPDKRYLETHCCCFTAVFENVTPKSEIGWLSESKCIEISKNRLTDNGKIVSAEGLKISITEVDWYNMVDCYEWDSCYVSNFMISERGLLPFFIRRTVAELYIDKNKLKNSGDNVLYLNKKEYLNGTFGMMVTSPIQDTYTYKNGEVVIDNTKSKKEMLEEAQTKYSNFTLYQWGVWIIAHARRALIKVACGEERIGNVSIYNDTDSDKFIAGVSHPVIDKWNNEARQKVRKAFKDLGFNPNLSGDLGQMVKENDKPLLFKSLGAKRYILRGDNKQEVTVAGCKKTGITSYARDKGVDLFDLFDFGLTVPPPYSGRTTSHYIDTPQHVCLKDKDGREWEGEIKSCIVVKDAEYTANIGNDYELYLSQKEVI